MDLNLLVDRPRKACVMREARLPRPSKRSITEGSTICTMMRRNA